MTPARRAFLVTVFFRLFCSAFAWQFGQSIPPNSYLASRSFAGPALLGPADGWRYLLYGIWDRFDTVWYLHIAANGYSRPGSIVFYPLYPLLIRSFSWLTREPLVAALAISTAACFFLLWGLQKLVELDWPGKETYCVWIFAAWPTAFIFMAGYADSLMIALAIWSIYFARKDRWWLAGSLACAAGFTKAAGALTLIPLLWLLVKGRRWNALPAVVLAPAGAAAYNLWLKLSGFPPINEIYAKLWATRVAAPWKTLMDAIPPVAQGDWLVGTGLFSLLFCFLVLVICWRMRTEYLLFSVACLTLFLTKYSDPILQSTPRYILLAFPIFCCAASWINNRKVLWLVLLVFCPFYFGMLRTFLWWGLIV